MNTKECQACLEIKPVDQFWVFSRSRDGTGYSRYCKVCGHPPQYHEKYREGIKIKDKQF